MNEKTLKTYKEMLERGNSQRGKIEEIVEKIMAKKEIKNVFLVGCGGSLACMFPCRYILETNSHLPAFAYNASEFLALKPVQFSKDSLVILSSYTGSTPETVKSAEYARKEGAPTIGFTGNEDSPLGKAVDYVFANDAETGVTDSKIIMLYQIIFNVMKHSDNYERYDEVMAALDTLPESLVKVKREVTERAKKFAKENKDEKYFMVIGSGACWGETYTYPTCILEEMQWILAQPVHAGEYFHGNFEIVRENTNLIIFKGEDLTRPLGDRVENFSRKYSKKITLIDTKDYALPGVAEDLRGFLSPLVLSAVMDVFSHYLAEERNHPLSTRKYMGKVEY